MANFLVAWKMEVDEMDTPEQAVNFVEDQYIGACENGHWIYEVTNLETGETKVVNGG
jgi:hypothetical protein